MLVDGECRLRHWTRGVKKRRVEGRVRVRTAQWFGIEVVLRVFHLGQFRVKETAELALAERLSA
jgi:hypothetical protein